MLTASSAHFHICYTGMNAGAIQNFSNYQLLIIHYQLFLFRSQTLHRISNGCFYCLKAYCC